MKLLIEIITVWIIGLLATSSVLSAPFDSKAQEGVAHYNQEEYDHAAEKFQESRLEQSSNRDVSYNLANSLYRLGRYEEAVEAYKNALDEKTRPALRQKSYYNMGNAYFRMGYLQESIDAYKKALELDSKDMDSKFNLEWARKQLKKAQQSGRIAPRDENILQQQASSQRPNNPPDPRKEPEQSSDAKSQKSENTETPENPSKNNKPDPVDKFAEAPPAPLDDELSEEEQTVRKALNEMTQMTPQEAERWLDSLSEDLKKIARRQMQGKMKDMFADHDKDW